MKRYISINVLGAFCATLLLLTGCFKESSDDKLADTLLLMSLNSTTPEQAAADIQLSVSSVSSGLVPSMTQVEPTTEPGVQKAAVMKLNQQAVKQILRDAISTPARQAIVFDGECDLASCDTTVSGNQACSRGGTVIFENVALEYNSSGTEFPITFQSSLNGAIELNRCGIQAMDWFAYPSYTEAVIDGDLEVQNNTTSVYNSLEFTNDEITYNVTGMIGQFTTSENSIIESDSLTVEGRAFTSVDLMTDINLAITSGITNIVMTNNENIYKMTADFDQTLTGHVRVSGTIGENTVLRQRDFSAENFRFHSACIANMDTMTSDCTITKY